MGITFNSTDPSPAGTIPKVYWKNGTVVTGDVQGDWRTYMPAFTMAADQLLLVNKRAQAQRVTFAELSCASATIEVGRRRARLPAAAGARSHDGALTLGPFGVAVLTDLA